ncbi:MAG: nitroreductase [Rhodobiaceae bacterium]|nr:nitroreductase [Rhodobiaceae bacterium]MCC0055965.1 nitroreductase [Rhodobiaceae bacterium]
MTDIQNEVIAHLSTRRSAVAREMDGPGPDEAGIAEMLKIAARVPDHGKIAPWRFIVVEGEARAALAERLLKMAEEREGPIEGMRRDNELARFTRPAVTVVVVSAPRPHPKVPRAEQVASAAAVCMNLIHAAHAYGFAAQWLTGWQAFDDGAARLLGVTAEETVAGFISIGTRGNPLDERDRPDVPALTSRWKPDNEIG